MKRGIIITGIVLLGATLLTSCEDLLNELGIIVESDYYETEIIIPPTSDGEYYLADAIMKADIEQALEDAGEDRAAIIKYITVSEAWVIVNENSPIADLSVVDAVIGSIAAEGYDSDTVAFAENNGAAVTEIELEVNPIDVALYLESESFAYAVHGKLNGPLTDTLKLTARLKFDIAIQGALIVPEAE